MTLATGSRGASTREIFKDPGHIPGCEGIPSPCGVAVALGTLDGEYASQEAAYDDRFDGVPGFSKTFVAGTDTFARGWMQTFSDLARRYDVYILGSNNQPEFRESVDPTEIEEFADPDLENPTSAFVATGPEVYNEAFMWGPKNVTPDGPRPLRNVVASNKKVPLTDIENLITLTPGPSTGPDAIENVRPFRIPGTKARMSFATSLPAFVYDGGPVTPFGEAPGPGIDPCADTSKYYMYCLDALGTNLVMQDEANPGEWATQSGWQPLEWMSSTWRSSADPTVELRLQRHPAHGRQPRRPAVRRSDRDHPARAEGPARGQAGAGEVQLRRQRPPPARGSVAVRGLRRPEARVPRTRALGCSRRPAQRAARHRRPRSHRGPAIPARTTTSRRRSSPTCRTRRSPTGTTAADANSPMRDHRGMETGSQPLRDAHGRSISDLRVSVTDRCNFRCQYCMPADGLPWLERDEVLSLRGDRAPRRPAGPARHRGRPADRWRAARPPRVPATGLDARPGPGARRPLADDQRLPARAGRRRARRCRHRPGQRLDRLARPRPLLPDHPPRRACRRSSAGSRRSPRHPRVRPIKVNAIAMRDFTERRGRCASSSWPGPTDYQVRFIEFMPLDADGAWTPDAVLTGAEIRALIERTHELVEVPREPSATARVYRFADGDRRDRLHQPGQRALLRGLQPPPPHRRGQAPHLPLLDPRDRPPRAAPHRRLRRRPRGDHPRRRLAQGAQAPRRRARLPPPAAVDERHRGVDNPGGMLRLRRPLPPVGAVLRDGKTCR